jgi:hypothetical protein
MSFGLKWLILVNVTGNSISIHAYLLATAVFSKTTKLNAYFAPKYEESINNVEKFRLTLNATLYIH